MYLYVAFYSNINNMNYFDKQKLHVYVFITKTRYDIYLTCVHNYR